MDILLSLFNVNFIEYQTKFVLNRILKAERSFGCLFFFKLKNSPRHFFGLIGKQVSRKKSNSDGLILPMLIHWDRINIMFSKYSNSFSYWNCFLSPIIEAATFLNYLSPISRGPAPRLVFLSWHINKVSIYLSIYLSDLTVDCKLQNESIILPKSPTNMKQMFNCFDFIM